MNNLIIPHHIAFIMDGNRRWARKRMLPVIAGHHKGAEMIEPLVEYAAKKGIAYVTFWAFSSENWKRGDKEVGFLMRVFREFIKSSVINRMMDKGVRVNVIGDIESFPEDIVRGVREIVEKSRNNTTITATFALNYGGRKEILRAVNNIVKEIPPAPFSKGGAGGGGFIDESKFASLLYTSDLPDPDLIVRTGGSMRLSGFLPWQAAYSELYFTETYWPDFTTEKFEEALEEYTKRERRFGN